MEENQISKNFSKTGIIWPLKISSAVNTINLEKSIFNFNQQQIKYLGKKIALKPHILSKFFFQLACDENVVANVKKNYW